MSVAGELFEKLEGKMPSVALNYGAHNIRKAMRILLFQGRRVGGGVGVWQNYHVFSYLKGGIWENLKKWGHYAPLPPPPPPPPECRAFAILSECII